MDFEDRENKVLDFMDKVKEIKNQEKQDEEFQNSTKYKLRKLDQEEDKAKGICLDMVFSKLYKDALPLNDDYKVSHGEDLDAEIKDFIHCRAPKGMEYYVKEGIKRGSTAARKIMESVESIVDQWYMERGQNIEDWNVEDLVFRTGEDLQQKINVVNQDLALDDMTQVIRDNVKASALSEIKRAKKEKEAVQNLENELVNDMKVTSEAAIDHRMELAGFTEKRTFEPTLFQGIMIGNLNKLTKMEESGNLEPEFLYDTLLEYGLEKPEGETEATIEERAFVESVKEYTKLNLLKAMKLERFTKRELQEMANDYASN